MTNAPIRHIPTLTLSSGNPAAEIPDDSFPEIAIDTFRHFQCNTSTYFLLSDY